MSLPRSEAQPAVARQITPAIPAALWAVTGASVPHSRR
jgi:hypothetical protein